MSLTISHTHAEGTMLHGTSRGDGSADVLRTRPGGAVWKWSRNLGAWFVVHSRDHLPHRHRIAATAEALRAAGFQVDTEVDDTARPTAEVVEERRERAADRAEHFEAKAERRHGEAEGFRAASDVISDGIPMGQPILVGHHSERRHRKDLERMHRLDVKSWEARAAARYAEQRAQASRAAASGREARSTVQNRIDKLAADIARDLRSLWGVPADMRHLPWTAAAVVSAKLRGHGGPVDPDSERGRDLCARIVEATDRRAYWAEVLAAMPTGVDPKVVRKGDLICHRFGWARVARVNAKTVSVETGYNWTDRVPWSAVTAHRPAQGETAAPVELDMIPAGGASS